MPLLAEYRKADKRANRLFVERCSRPGQITGAFIGCAPHHHLAIRCEPTCVYRASALPAKTDLPVARALIKDRVPSLRLSAAIDVNGIISVGPLPLLP